MWMYPYGVSIYPNVEKEEIKNRHVEMFLSWLYGDNCTASQCVTTAFTGEEQN